MIPARRNLWLRAFSALSQVWPQLEPTAARIRVYDEALSDLTEDELDYAVRWVLANHSGTFVPPPGLFRDVVHGPLTKVAQSYRADGKITHWKLERRRSEEHCVPPPGRLPPLPPELQSGNGATQIKAIH